MTEELKDKIVEYEKEKHYVHVDNAKNLGYLPIEPYQIKAYGDGSYGILVTNLEKNLNTDWDMKDLKYNPLSINNILKLMDFPDNWHK